MSFSILVVDDQRRRRVTVAGAHQFLTKPVDLVQLREALRRLSALPTDRTTGAR